uniref:Ig-like domain-containing protein n=1 Tax=Panagrellus redivivus TaxID=6233 RepID=A0A7E4V9E6_PANRE
MAEDPLELGGYRWLLGINRNGSDRFETDEWKVLLVSTYTHLRRGSYHCTVFFDAAAIKLIQNKRIVSFCILQPVPWHTCFRSEVADDCCICFRQKQRHASFDCTR